MHLINDVDFKAGRDWPVGSPVNDITHIIHTCIAGRVHFQNVNMPPVIYICARPALATGRHGGPAFPVRAFTIQAFCQNPRG